ncbi:DUF2938 domain-containing protein [Pseudodonghicola xiamenensis]|uniref:DUF2938 domain-containing protein n=1 Tax=Pseudodonghicola xiamenensis TaxID=337702 RepID=A0A8J3MBP0_9RHOB|nr:DUF2938 domain-containing protein [Pseudodonghicola xiamenensis]GHG86153.1 hypothetical protein GCM10010961_13880 [Pseudodonghicola xiamenensis]
MPLTDIEILPLAFEATFLGAGATLIMDLVALARRRLFDTPSLDYALVGRWLGSLPKGRLVHRPITKSPPITGERPLGWAAHYLIGIIFAAAFLLIAPLSPGAGPSLPSALLFGLATVGAPFFLLHPCLGAGIAARATPRPWVARRNSMTAHLSFGLGLWITGWAQAIALSAG